MHIVIIIIVVISIATNIDQHYDLVQLLDFLFHHELQHDISL